MIDSSAAPAEQYLDDVLAGRQVAGRFVRLLAERHRADLEHGHERGLYFDPVAAQHVINFFQFLRHSKGEWAGQVMRLEPWQQALLWVLFGWMRTDTGKRRFRQAYIEVARKNGKSTWASGIGLYLLVADGEPGAEVYSAATKRDQAAITHREASRMVRKSPVLKKRVKIFKDNLHIENTASKFEPLGRDADSLDGLNVHGALVDELHAHRTSEMWDVLDTATGSRRQSLILGITTAGFNQGGFCYDLRKYALRVAEGWGAVDGVKDDAFFSAVYTLDEGDRWDDEAVWVKANPNLGVSVYWDDLRRKAQQAKDRPLALANFMTKHLNVWVTAAEQWLHPNRWAACLAPYDERLLAGRPCYGGLDLSNTLDVTALVWVFPPWKDDERWRVLPRLWAPEETIREKGRTDRALYGLWAQEGSLIAIPGEVIDYAWIYEQMDRDAQVFDVREVAYDRWGAAEIYLRMEQAGLTMVQMGQGFSSMSAPMKTLERMIVSKELAHPGNPMLTWMAHNLVAVRDPAGNIKPDKKDRTEKIDGMVALIMAIGRATLFEVNDSRSIYEERGLIEV